MYNPYQPYMATQQIIKVNGMEGAKMYQMMPSSSALLLDETAPRLFVKITDGAGITVCKEWHDRENFKKWARDNGWEKGLRLTRKDSLKGYSPENCYFSDYYVSKGRAKKARDIKKHRQEMKKFSNMDGEVYEEIKRAYHAIKVRCFNANDYHYKDYGARGITVCDEWMGKDGIFYFYKWAIENGWSKGLSIDRIDVNGNYEPTNCRWATAKEQANNKRNTRLYEYYGRQYTIKEVADLADVSYSRLLNRIKKGMTVEEAVLDIRKKETKKLLKK